MAYFEAGDMVYVSDPKVAAAVYHRYKTERLPIEAMVDWDGEHTMRIRSSDAHGERTLGEAQESVRELKETVEGWVDEAESYLWLRPLFTADDEDDDDDIPF